MIQANRRDRPTLSELVRSVPPHLLEVTQHPATGRSEPRWDWPGEEWLGQLRGAGVGERLISSSVKFVEAEQLCLVKPSARLRESPACPSAVLRRLADALAEERGWQLAGMTEAMTRFVESIYV